MSIPSGNATPLVTLVLPLFNYFIFCTFVCSGVRVPTLLGPRGKNYVVTEAEFQRHIEEGLSHTVLTALLRVSTYCKILASNKYSNVS